jgi:cytosine/adenosine deaminase-related metal-dependent hydrolase
MPGFVDAHCHLEWALTAGLAPGGEFGSWLGTFLAAVSAAGPGFTAAAADAGALAALCAGTTTLCDSGPTGAGAAAMARLGLQGLSCVEAFGTGPSDTLGPAIRRIRDAYGRAATEPAPGVAIGMSPHAPYSVGPAFWDILLRDPEWSSLPWTTHFAESPAELVAIGTGGGTIATALSSRGVRPAHWPGEDGEGVITRLARAGALRRGTVAAHCIQLTADEPALLADYGVRVAHCPISNAYLGCGVAPLRALRAAGVRIGLGTDSPASAGNYDVRAEARACALMQGNAGLSLTPRELVRLATLGGAEALGLDDELGSIVPGKRANMVALAPALRASGVDPHVAALDPGTRVTRVWTDGVLRLVDADVPGIDVARIATRAAEARQSVC